MSKQRVVEILSRHKDDTEQTNFIQMDESCILTAPAGYGKTDSVISKIMYLIESGAVYFPKKILVLTLSNVAKHTIEKRLKDRIPDHLNIVDIYNFHTFAARILKIHGKTFVPVPIYYNYDYNHSNLIKSDKNQLEKHFELITDGKYKELIPTLEDTIQKLRFYKRISYEHVILLAVLVLEYGKKKIYHNIYPYIFIDEFQDVSKFQWHLIKAVFNSESQKIFCAGDEFQSIMKFADALGAEFISQAKNKLSVEERFELKTNYRLKNTPQIDLFQRFIRGEKCNFSCDSSLQIQFFNDFQAEIEWIINTIETLRNSGTNQNYCILVTGYNYFWKGKDNPELNEYGSIFFQKMDEMFKDQYIDTTMGEKEKSAFFYIESLAFCAQQNKILSFYSLKKYISTRFNGNPYLNNFLALIDGYREYCRMYNINFTTIKEVLEKDELIRYVGYSKKYSIFISNIHKAKGAEWDYVFIPSLSPYLFPNYYTCNECIFNQNDGQYSCESNKLLDPSLDFYQLFYVAVTRPRKGLYISAYENKSCLFHHISPFSLDFSPYGKQYCYRRKS